VVGDTTEWKSYELDRIVSKRYTKYGRKKNLEYLVKYKGYSNAFNEWFPVKLLPNAKELIAEYEANITVQPTTPITQGSENQRPRRRGRPREHPPQ
jgi:hypothetical protein